MLKNSNGREIYSTKQQMKTETAIVTFIDLVWIYIYSAKKILGGLERRVFFFKCNNNCNAECQPKI